MVVGEIHQVKANRCQIIGNLRLSQSLKQMPVVVFQNSFRFGNRHFEIPESDIRIAKDIVDFLNGGSFEIGRCTKCNNISNRSNGEFTVDRRLQITG